MSALTDPVAESIDRAHAALAETAGRPLVIEHLADPFIEGCGHHVASKYCESFWLPVIGPSALWLLRHGIARVGDGPYVVDPEVLGKSVGLHGTFHRNAPLARTLERLRQFQCADGGWGDTWRFRSHLPQLARRHLVRLPAPLRAEHDAFTGGEG